VRSAAWRNREVRRQGRKLQLDLTHHGEQAAPELSGDAAAAALPLNIELHRLESSLRVRAGAPI